MRDAKSRSRFTCSFVGVEHAVCSIAILTIRVMEDAKLFCQRNCQACGSGGETRKADSCDWCIRHIAAQFRLPYSADG